MTLLRRPLLAAAATTLALSLPAASQPPAKAPKTLLYIDVATHSMPGMPELGGLGRMAMGMFGGKGGSNSYGTTRFPAMPGQYLDIALRNSLNPGGEATQQIPAGLRLGDSLPLLAPKAEVQEPGEPSTYAGGKIPDSTTRILIYWGCGTQVRPGQPKVIEFTTKDGKFKATGSMQGRYAPDRDARTGPDTALWPNERNRHNVPEGASLVGEHRVSGDRVPESLKFALDQSEDFLPKILLTHSGDLASGQTWRWQPVTRARGYFLYAMGTQDGAMVMWSSSETADAGMGVANYLPNATVDKWIKEKVLLAPSVNSCAMPKGIFAAQGEKAGGGMLQMIAYGPESNLSWPPKPADPKAAWNPEWNVRVRTKSTAMSMLGMDFGAAMSGQEQDGEPAQPQEKPMKKLLRGLLGH